MAPHIFTHPDMLLQTIPTPGESSVDSMRLNEPLVDSMRLDETMRNHACSFVLMCRDTAPRSNEAAPFPKPNGLDNTVGPVPKISGYVFNTLQTNSAGHVLNTTMNPMNEDTHICDLNLYETMFQTWCITESPNMVTPDTAINCVAPPNANTFSEACPLSKVEIGPLKSTCFTGSNPDLSGEMEL